MYDLIYYSQSRDHSFIRFLNRHLETLAPGNRVLDCACGTGDPAIHLPDRFDVVACDIDDEMLRLAATKARGNGLKRIRFCVARWDSLPFTYAKGFDAVLCCGNSIGQLQSSTERKLSLTGMANALVRKGLIYVDFREDYSRNNSGDFIATEVVGPIERERQRLLFVVFERCDKDVIERTKVCYSAGNENLQELRRVVTRYRPFSRRELKDELACAGFEKIKFARRPGKWPLSAFFAIRA